MSHIRSTDGDLCIWRSPQGTAIDQRTRRHAAVEMMKDVRAMAVAYESRVKQSGAMMDTEFPSSPSRPVLLPRGPQRVTSCPTRGLRCTSTTLNKPLEQLSAVYATAR